MAESRHLAPGLWGILATPFRGADLAIDADSLGRQVGLFRELSASGVVALGVFGEGASLDAREQREVISTVVAAGDGLPVVAGLSALRTAPAIDQARNVADAADVPLAGLMVQVNSPQPAVLIRHLTAIHETTGVGIVLQDYPLSSGVTIPTARLLETLESCPFVVAVKAEAPPTAVAIAALTSSTDIPVFGGLGGVGLLDELAAGAAGAMTGFSRPEALLAALDAWNEGGMSAAHDAFSRWLPLANFETQPGIGLALRKEVFRLRGIFAESSVRPPAPPMPTSLRPILQQHLDKLEMVNS